MRIAIVTGSFLPRVGGAEFVVHHLACAWHRQGHEVCVMNTDTAQATHAEGRYTVKRFKLPRGASHFGHHKFPWGWVARHKLTRLLREFEPDVISAHGGFPSGVWLSRINPLPRFVVTCHGSELHKASWGNRARYGLDGILPDALNRSAGVIAISTQARQWMEEMGVQPSRILAIPNGVDIERFAVDPQLDIRGELGVPDGSVMILSVGRDHAAKAYDTGIKAFAKLIARGCDAYYVLLGKGTDRWRPLAKALGVGDRVIFHDGMYGEKLVGALKQADIFFSPSTEEVLALVVLEAMAAGLPEVVTNISGSQDVIETGKNGVVVEPDQPEAMANALHQLAMDEDLRARMGAANLERAPSYSWDRISRLYLEAALDSQAGTPRSPTSSAVAGGSEGMAVT